MKKIHLSWVLLVGITAMLSTVFSFFCFQQWWLSEKSALKAELATVKTNVRPTMVSTRFLDAPESFVEVSDRMTPAVVNISSYSDGMRSSGGSGVVISPDGYIITNLHVIEGGSQVDVTFSDKREYQAETVGVDPNTDLALLKVNAQDLTTMSFGNSDDIRVGEWVLAIGNPFNLASTVTAGIISAKARNINILRDAYAVESFIQTDAVVNPGNSGGALINSKGELIGINTAIISETGGYEGYSFAIPANLVRKVISDLRTFGAVRRALLGVNITDIDADLATSLGLPSVAGVLVRGINAGSSAEEAGLKAWDVIVSVNGQPTSSVPELQEQIARLRPGDMVSLEYYRDGELKRKQDVKLKGLTAIREN